MSFLISPGNPSSLRIAQLVQSDFEALSHFETHTRHESLGSGDFLIALSYPRLVPLEKRNRFLQAAVLHASNLPTGRGWSPANWQLSNLETQLCVSLIAMEDAVDSGAILAQAFLEVPLSQLWQETEKKMEYLQANLIGKLLRNEVSIGSGKAQAGVATYYPRRTKVHSKVDPLLPICEQWGIFRAADSTRFPNYFFLHGRKYEITIEDLGEANED